ncbi:uncharacterized protein LOC114528698 [Dendronephthya gigantea]|uniref:uncharacterized protein LOC114528698 n=1 Tax=Dendronephthya gigantea TaxID=151771 RepID=UPI00106B4816|nr:uncharacterized protein LOC114528698 [Dendronephthya gigantea]
MKLCHLLTNMVVSSQFVSYNISVIKLLRRTYIRYFAENPQIRRSKKFEEQQNSCHSRSMKFFRNMAQLTSGGSMHTRIFYVAWILLIISHKSFSQESPTTPAPTLAPTTPPGPEWPAAIREALEHRDSFLEAIRTIKDDHTVANVRASIPKLEALLSAFESFHEVDFKTAQAHDDEETRKLFRKISEKFTKIQVRDLYRPLSLEKDYQRTGLGYALGKFKNIYDIDCLYKLISPPKAPREIRLPLDKMCVGMKAPNSDYAPISTICRDFNTCVQSEDDDTSDACTSGNKCDIPKAVPKFAALLWYKISNYLVQVICGTFSEDDDRLSARRHSQRDDDDEEDVRKIAYQNMQRDLKHVMSYMMNTDWDNFFSSFVSSGGFSTLPRLMELVGERREFMSHAAVACNDLNAESVCAIADIYKQYTLLAKIAGGSMVGPIRDLRVKEGVNIAGLLSKTKDDMQHLETMAAISSVDANLEASVAGIASYFRTLAQFDQDIAQQDVGYIDDKLKEFRKKTTEVQGKLKGDFGTLMGIVETALAAQLISEVTRLASVIAENSNPMKVMLTGVDVDELYERTTAVVAAAQQVVVGARLVEAIKNLAQDSLKLIENFQENRNQLDGLMTLVDATTDAESDVIKKNADKFVEDYGAYTPMVNRADLDKNSGLWTAYKERACELLSGASGEDIELPIGQTVQGVLLLCEKLEGTLAEYFTLREEIFDFQFQLVDALTKVIRGVIAKDLASSIEGKNEVFNVYDLVRGFAMQHHNLQSNIYLYCNILQYKNHGRRDRRCLTSGFFDYAILNELTEITEPPYYTQSRYVFIPTRPERVGDTGYINLPSLAAGNDVIFQLPRDRVWLTDNKWITCEEVTAPFVSSIKVYLPLGDYSGVQERHTVTTTTIASDLGSFAHYNKDIRYLLPTTHTSFITTYEKGHRNCPFGKEMADPYGLCETIPNICDNTDHDLTSTVLLRPTILSSWKLSYSVMSGSNRVDWIAPKPATKLYFLAKVTYSFGKILNKESERYSYIAVRWPAVNILN